MPIAVGLDIGSEAVRAAAVQPRGSLPVLRRFGEAPLPGGAVVAGEIIDQEAVVGALRALWKRRRLPRRRVVVGVAGPRVIARRVEVPRLRENELVESLPGRVQGHLPLPVEEAVLDYVPLAESISADGNPMLSLLVVAVPRETVDLLLEVARQARLEVTSIDLQAFGLVRAAFGAELRQQGEGSVALLDIGATLTQVAVVRGGVTCFVRHLPVGGHRFTEALVAGTPLGREEAEERKRSIGVVPWGMPAGEDEPARLSRLLTQEADRFIAEVRGALDEYRAEDGDRALARLVVSGNGARLPHLANRIGRALGTRVEPARVLDHITVGRTHLSEPQLLELQPVLPAAVGLALWGSFVVLPAGPLSNAG